MKALKLEDIRPQAASFSLGKTGRTYELRPIGLDDEKWIRDTFGDRIQKVLEGTDMREIGRIIWRLMKEDDRKQFPAKEIEETDESGITRIVNQGGVNAFVACIIGIQEKIEIHRALLATIGISKPLLDELMEQELKKNLPLGNASPPAGEQSLTSSPPNTDGPLTTSGSLPRAKSASRSGKSTPAEQRTSPSRRSSTASKSQSRRTAQR